MKEEEHCELEQRTAEASRKMGIPYYQLECPIKEACVKGACRFALTEDQLLAGLFHRGDYNIRSIDKPHISC